MFIYLLICTLLVCIYQDKLYWVPQTLYEDNCFAMCTTCWTHCKGIFNLCKSVYMYLYVLSSGIGNCTIILTWSKLPRPVDVWEDLVNPSAHSEYMFWSTLDTKDWDGLSLISFGWDRNWIWDFRRIRGRNTPACILIWGWLESDIKLNDGLFYVFFRYEVRVCLYHLPKNRITHLHWSG
jgi:hypothetical protein